MQDTAEERGWEETTKSVLFCVSRRGPLCLRVIALFRWPCVFLLLVDVPVGWTIPVLCRITSATLQSSQ